MLSILLAAVDASVLDSDFAKATFGFIVLAAIGYGISLLRDLRKNVTAEVRMQIAADDAEAETARIPNPLTVKTHVDFTTRHEHQELKKEFENLREQRRQDVSGLHQKIEHGLRKTSDDISRTAAEIGKLQVSQTQQTSELHAIRTEQSEVSKRIDAIPQRVIQTLKDTKGLI